MACVRNILRFFGAISALCAVLFFISTPTLASDGYANQVVDIYDFYQKTNQHEIDKLIELDKKLRGFIEGLPRNDGYRVRLDWKSWKQEYASLGLYFSHYGNDVLYDGRFLLNAYKLNPHSKYREYTLYSQVLLFGDMMPNSNVAKQYIKEFPNGSFVANVYLILANFNKDLYMVLRDKDKDYKYDCYEQYIEDKNNYDKQKEDVKKLALAYYGRYLQLKPNDVWANKFEKQLRDDSITGWSFCSD